MTDLLFLSFGTPGPLEWLILAVGGFVGVVVVATLIVLLVVRVVRGKK